MSNKNIFVFGGTGSIGSALSKKLIENKYSPIIISRNEDDLKKLSDEINCEYRVCDVLDYENVKKISDEFNDNLFGIAYCAGSINLKPLKMTKDDEFLDSFKVNTLGAVNAIKLNQDALSKNNGSILLFSTIAVKQGFTNHAIVSTAKGAIEGLTLSLAAEFAPKIKVNCIAPSLTKSKISSFLLKNEKIAESIAKMHPLKRLGEGHDSSSVANFLLSDSSSWITGQILGVDGGRSSLT